MPKKEPVALPRAWQSVAAEFFAETGIQVGVPRANEDPAWEADFLDNRQWEGRDPRLAERIGRRDVVRELVVLVAQIAAPPARQRKPGPVGRRRFVEDHVVAARYMAKASRFAQKALGTPGVDGGLFEVEELDAAAVLAEIGYRGVAFVRGRPRLARVRALRILMAFLDYGLKTAKGAPLADADMARLIALMCPELLGLEQRDVVEVVRKHRRGFHLNIFITPEGARADVWHPPGMEPHWRDMVDLLEMWNGIKIQRFANAAVPRIWRKARRMPERPQVERK